jgi:beta-N-acetylhexosaminidase
MLSLGLAAGNDLLMICHRVDMLDQARAVLAKQPESVRAPALRRVADFKKKMEAPTVFSLEEFAAINRDIWDLRVATLGEERAREKSVEDGKRSPVEIY